MNCPFYGRAMFSNMLLPLRILLLDTHGNQCALVTSAHSPCVLEAGNRMVEWAICPRVREMRMEAAELPE